MEQNFKRSMSRLGFGMTVFYLVVTALQVAVIATLNALWPEGASQVLVTMLATDVCMYLLALPVAMLVLRKLPNAPQKAPEGRQKMTFGGMLRLQCIAFLLTYAFNVVTLLLNGLIGLLKGSPVQNPLELSFAGQSVWQTFIVMCVIPPVCEELVFRGYLYRKLAGWGEKTFVLMSGLCFGLFHGNISQALYATALGVFFAWLYLRTGKLRWGMIIHAILNFVGSVLILWLLEGRSEEEAMVISGCFGLFVIAVCAAGLVCLLLERGKGHFKLEKSATLPEHPVKAAMLNAGMLAYWAVFLLSSVLMIVGTDMMVK